MGQKQVSLDLSFAQEDSKDMCHYSGRVLPLLPHQQLLSTSQNLVCVPVLPEHTRY